MQGFGRYSALHQAHARAAAEKATKEGEKDAAREVTDRRQERRDRDPPAREAARAAPDRSADQGHFRPSRPMTADAWSLLLPNGPSPGETERHYILRRLTLGRQIREEVQAAAENADRGSRLERTEADPGPRRLDLKKVIAKHLAAAQQPTKESGGKDKGEGIGIDSDD